MKLSTTDLASLGQIAIQAAKQAGQLISSYQDKKITTKIKPTGDTLAAQVVTEVDLLSQEIILKTLKPTCEHFDLAMLTEESTDDQSRLEKDYFWCIDPLDGTLSFIEATPGYAVSIALVSKQGLPQIGVIYDPVNKNLYHAIKDQGVFLNNQPWELTQPMPVQEQSLSFNTDRSFLDHERINQIIDGLKRIAKEMGYKNLNIIKHGGAAMNACWVLEQAPACYFKFPKTEPGGGSLWDFAASACIFNEINAVVHDIEGHPLDLNRRDSTFMNHHGVIYASNTELAKKIIELHAQLAS